MPSVKFNISWTEALDCSATVVLEVPEGSNPEEMRDMIIKGDADIQWIDKVKTEMRTVEERTVLDVEEIP